MAWFVEIYEGNGTLRRVMSEALARSGFRVNERDADSPLPEKLADILVLDVDSGLPLTQERAQAYVEDERPVVYVGVRRSRDRFPGVPWVDRPFDRSAFVSQVRRLIDTGDSDPGDVSDQPITRELEIDEGLDLEMELGLDLGLLDGISEESDGDIVSIEDHGSIILDISDLASGNGGRLSGAISQRTIDAQELQADRLESIKRMATRSSTFNQTMPDTPLALDPNGSDAHPIAITEDLKSTTTEPTVVPRSGDNGEFEPLFKSISRMLAESWNGIGLAARTDDRADRIERIIKAGIEGGVRAAAEELQRIPSGHGFGGSLLSLTVIEVLRTVRDRRLRGRLELDVPDGTFAIYLDSDFLEGIDLLSGSEDLVILDTLLEMGQLAESQYTNLVQGYATGEFVQPATMKLVREDIVTAETLLAARRKCTRETLRRLVMSRRGNFSFLEIHPGDGQPWPIKGIHQSSDELLLEILREASFDTGDSQATARTRLVADVARATRIDKSKLTEDELRVLGFFRGPETLGDARESLPTSDVDRVVDRLKKLELLKRTDPALKVPAELAKFVGIENTVVSPVPDALSRKEKAQTTDGNLAETDLKQAFEIGPKTDNMESSDVDALLEEGLADLKFDELSEDLD